MAVSMTATLADNFGSGATLPGTGIVLNNAMQWFNPEPGTPVSLMPGGQRPEHDAATGQTWRRPGSRRRVRGRHPNHRRGHADRGQFDAPREHGVLDAVLAEPRIDASRDFILADSRLPQAVVQGLRRRGFEVDVVIESPHAHQFSRPIAAAIDYERGLLVGAADPLRPAVAAGF